MSHILVTFLFLLLISCDNSKTSKFQSTTIERTQKVQEKTLIGQVYRNTSEIPEFIDFEDHSSGVLEITNPEVFGIQLIHRSDLFVLVLDSIIYTKGNQEPKYKILDTLNLGALNEKTFTVGFQTCYIDTNYAPDVVGVFKSQNKAFLDKPIRVWRVDKAKGKFFSIDTTKVRYFDTGFDDSLED